MLIKRPVNTTVFINVLDTTPVKVDPAITWSNPADIKVGTVLSATQLNATANVSGSFAYTPLIGTKLGIGNAQSIMTSFTPIDTRHYNTVNKTVYINVLDTTVTKLNPVITWNNPADIVSGIALSATQLNATANVPGTFIYNPASGAIIGTGNSQTLSVEFTPTDLSSYNKITKTVVINVLLTSQVSELTSMGYNVYPNPARDYIGIESKTPIYSVTIIEMNGRIAEEIVFDGVYQAHISLKKLLVGRYIVLAKNRFNKILFSSSIIKTSK